MKAIIRLDVPEWQIGREVKVYFPDTMCVTGTCEIDAGIPYEERPKGKWEITYGDHIRAGLRPIMYACGICGMVGSRTNYCPNCGARMED